MNEQENTKLVQKTYEPFQKWRYDGNTAIVTGVNHVKGRDDKNQPFDLRVRFTIKRDGRWQA